MPGREDAAPGSDRPPCLILIGYRGCGKSTVGQLLAQQLNWEHLDSDAQVASRAGKSIRRIFAEDGQAAFRQLEAEAVAQLVRRPRSVVSLGGGAVLRADNRRAIAACGSVIWLRARPETLAERILNDPATPAQRPDLSAAGGREEIDQLLAERTPLYRQCASLVVDTDGRSPAEVTAQILRELGGQPHGV
jgi:shikimate kinase